MLSQKGKKTILVADDDLVNRLLLQRILETEYSVKFAEDGLQALAVMREEPEISLLVLDLLMPNLDGFGVLMQMKESEVLSEIPVIVVTANEDAEVQVKALDNGAVDVVLKPFNPSVILSRIRNIIIRQDALRLAEQNLVYEQLLLQSETDLMSGLYSRIAFLEHTKKLLHNNPDKTYVIYRWDGDNFKIYNDLFGVEAGDYFLQMMGNFFKPFNKPDVPIGRWEADHFVLCAEQSSIEDEQLSNAISKLLSNAFPNYSFLLRIGVYDVDDRYLDISIMCDRAGIALRSIKGDYEKRVAHYTQAQRIELLEKQQIIAEMEPALQTGQFILYLQPQINYETKEICGAEALVRWNHPFKGLISPDKFIPVFESNGFISKMDEYVWEQACILLRKWADCGLPFVPISVNISRKDLYNPFLDQKILELVRKHGVSPADLRLEITESSYMDHPEQLITAVHQLQKSGFQVEMDDFGSGYSSLNTLKDVPVDKLKLDMKFLGDTLDRSRGGSVLSSVVRMAHWLSVPVLAEGVETREDADFLKSIGCYLMQGYYFAKPMPVSEFETLLTKNKIGFIGASEDASTVSSIRVADFQDATSQATLLFNSYVGGAAILEKTGDTVEIIRINQNLLKTIGVEERRFWRYNADVTSKFINGTDAAFLEALTTASTTKTETDCEIAIQLSQTTPKTVWIHARIRHLAKHVDSYIYYVSVENITKQKAAIQESTLLSAKIQDIFNHVPSGICMHQYKNDTLKTIYCNEMFWSLLGYSESSRQIVMEENPYQNIHQDDVENVKQQIRNCAETKTPVNIIYRVYQEAYARYIWISMSVAVVVQQDGTRLLYSGYQNVTERIEAEETTKAILNGIEGGVAVYKLGATAQTLMFTDGIPKMQGFTREEYQQVIDQDAFDVVYEADRKSLRDAARIAQQNGTEIRHTYRVYQKNKDLLWVNLIAYPSGEEQDGDMLYYAIFMAASKHFQLYQQIVDWSDIGITVIDQTTYEVYFANQEFFGNMALQANAYQRKPCYELFFDRAEPCEHCSMRDDVNNELIYESSIPKSNQKMRITMRHAEWMGRPVVVQYWNDMDEEQKRQEQNLAEQQRYRHIVKCSGMGLFDYDIVENTYYRNDHLVAYELGDFSMQDIKNRDIRNEVVDSRDIAKLDRFIAQIHDGKEIVEVELRAKQKNGNYRWVRISSFVMCNKDGAAIRIIGVVEDIETQKLAELKSLEQFEQQYRKCLGDDESIVSQVTFDLTRNRILHHATTGLAMRAVKNHTPIQTFLEKVTATVLREEDKQKILADFSVEALQKAYEDGKQVCHEYMRHNDSGLPIWVRTETTYMQNPYTGNKMAFACTYDISEKRYLHEIMKKEVQENFELFVIVDCKSKRVVYVMHQDYLVDNPMVGSDYETTNRHAFERFMAQDQVQEGIRAGRLSSVLGQLKKHNVYSYSFDIHNPSTGHNERKMWKYSWFDQKKTMFLMTRSDITRVYEDQIKRAQNLSDALQLAQNANQVKSAFLSSMGHDMRAPLNTVMGLAELGKQSENLADAKALHEKISETGGQVLKLVNDVLDMSKIESGKMEMRVAPCPSKKILAQVAGLWTNRAVLKDVTLRFEEKHQQEYLMIDLHWVQQILQQLVSNAVKFTPSGGDVTVLHEVSAINADTAILHIRVQDTGIGMSETFLKEQLYQPFKREQVFFVGEEMGTGVGLCITKRLVELMGGSITCESTVGAGTVFDVQIKVPIFQQQEHMLKEGNALRGMHILLCEDNRMNVQMMSGLMDRKGVKVTCTENGQIGLALFKNSAIGEFDAILMDIVMPELDGLETAKAIRQLKRQDAKLIPIIAITANQTAADEKKAREAGMDAYFTRPLDTKKLFDLLEDISLQQDGQFA